MALYNGKPVMIGADEYMSIDGYDDYNPWRSNASYFEVFDPQTEEWSDLKRNPFFPEKTRYYRGVTHQSITFDFGLRHIRVSHLVLGLHTLEYHTWSWSCTLGLVLVLNFTWENVIV